MWVNQAQEQWYSVQYWFCFLIIFWPKFYCNMIELKQVNKSFEGRQVLHDINAIFLSGKNNLIIGASGGGKSVMMKCMVGLERPDSGMIEFDGRNLLALEDQDLRDVRREIGMLFQGGALFDSMTVEQNVLFPMEMFSTINHTQKLKRVNEVLDRVNLVGANKKYPAEISGGMKKRVGIARSIVLNPKFLFCDEPNSGLDPQTSMVIDKLILDITREFNMTTVINTHDMNSVMEIGENILYLYQGQKEWAGNKKEIIFSKNERLNSFIFASEFLQDAKDMRMLEAKGKISEVRDMDELTK